MRLGWAGLALVVLVLAGCAGSPADDPAAARRERGLPAAVALVAALGVGAMVLRVLRAEPPAPARRTPPDSAEPPP